MASESVLLLGLIPEDIALIRLLLSSFDTDIESADIAQIENHKLFSEEKDISLVILRIREKPRIPVRVLQQIRFMLKYPVPILLLFPWDLTHSIPNYLAGGADDYWVLPLDNSGFAVQFYVMLEWGQAIVRSGTEKPRSNIPKASLWQRFSEKIQHSLEYFSPKSLLNIKDKTPIFRKWEKVKALGFGHCGEIWLIRKTNREEFAVAKIPHTIHNNIRFLRAAAILKRMEAHKNSVHLVEVVEDSRKVIVIEEFVPGLTLQQCLNNGMDSASREKAFLQLLDVMSYAHKLRIIHLDIKPDNIMVTPAGDLKLLDFGVARDLSHYSINDPGYGSRQYMAPEQFVGKSGIVSDVWSLGILLYVLSTGCFPFYDDSEINYLETLLQTPPIPPHNFAPDFPKNLETIIFRCLKTDVNDRYPHADELRVDLLLSFPKFGQGDILPAL